MTNQTTFRNLRYVLATIYDDEVSGRRMAQDAGLNVMNIAFSSRAIDNWRIIFLEARKIVIMFGALLKNEYDNHVGIVDPERVVSAEPYQEVLLTTMEQEFYQIARHGDGVLEMKELGVG